MKKIILIILVLFPFNAFSDQWKILGTRPMGMGGAFVAMAQGPIAQYWNPAGLAQVSTYNVSGFELPVGAMVELTGGIMEKASEIGDLANELNSIQSAQTSGGTVDAKQVSAFVKTLALLKDMDKPGKGALVDVAGGANFKFSKVAISINNYTTIGLNPYIDTVNVGLDNSGGGTGVTIPSDTSNPTDSTLQSAAALIDNAINTIGLGNIETMLCGSSGCSGYSSSQLANALVNEAANHISKEQIYEAAQQISEYANQAAPVIQNLASGHSYKDNQSRLDINGGSFTEIAFGYAKAAKFLSGLYIGGNLKAINGRIPNTSFKFMNDSDTENAIKDALDNTKSTWRPGLDLGFLWNLNEKYPSLPMRPRVGLVIRNINSPKFDKPLSNGSYKLDSQARMGIALSPLNFWHLAMDIDLTKNKTSVDGFNSRQLAFGTEINIINRKAFNIPLRAGISKNIAESSSKTVYSFGTGINLLYMHFDVSGQISSGRTEIEGTKYPDKFAVAASFGLLF